jgi:hypothetical protein
LKAPRRAWSKMSARSRKSEPASVQLRSRVARSGSAAWPVPGLRVRRAHLVHGPFGGLSHVAYCAYISHQSSESGLYVVCIRSFEIPNRRAGGSPEAVWGARRPGLQEA